ncbi:MAG: disulfide bond formation protein B [Planctomycetaceae bacterium]|nr:disulfide bond formation protein B [Planctomycetaceae bacterium]
MNLVRAIIANFCTLAVCGVLLGAFGAQFIGGELPCPLCILQRMAMLLCAAGPAWLLATALRREVDATDYARCYGASALAAVLGAGISARQVLLHIAPGDPGYGAPVLGMHLYTWALVVFMTVIAVAAAHLMLLAPAHPERLPLRAFSRATFAILALITLANAAAVFAEEGFHAVLPDNPVEYRLLDDLGLKRSS